MEPILIEIPGGHNTICVYLGEVPNRNVTFDRLFDEVAAAWNNSIAQEDDLHYKHPICSEDFWLVQKGGTAAFDDAKCALPTDLICSGAIFEVRCKILGGIDFQNRVGSKIGSGGQLSESQAAVDRKERLRKLALETIDISKDPYFMRNHLGSYECKLCLTLHTTEGNYLAHTQGKRHQSNLGRRAAMEAKNVPIKAVITKEVPIRRAIKIGRPGYKVTKSRDMHTKQRCLTFEVDFPEALESVQPRHRFMSAYEQKVEAPDKNYQYLLVACEPYETVAFKIPNLPLDKREGRFFTNWDEKGSKFVLQLYFLEVSSTV